MSNPSDLKPSNPTPRAKGAAALSRLGRRGVFTAAVIGAFAVGAGATAVAQRSHTVAFVQLAPAPITAMKDWSQVAVKGEVSEVFGNKFVIQDDTGRALVETGRQGEGGKLVAKAETVMVQGRFEHGFVHAMAIQHADGRNDLLGPAGPGRPHPPAAIDAESGPRRDETGGAR